MVGAYAVRHAGDEVSATGSVRIRGLVHPVVVAMVAGNVTIFVLSLRQLLT